MKGRGFPKYEEVEERIDRFVAKHEKVARLERIGVSDEGRPVRAVFVTDRGVPDADKQVVLVVCGRHGDEVGTRVVGPAVLEWLVSDAGAETRARQLVAVVAVANPDGAARNAFGLPSDRLTDFEERTIVALALRLRADAVLDFHSLDNTDIQAVITAHTARVGEEEFIHRELARRMVESAAREGFVYLVEAGGAGSYNNWFCGACYESVKPVVFGFEVNHFVLDPEQAAASAVSVVRSLLEAGNRRWPWQQTAGYPNGIILGDFRDSIRCFGPARQGDAVASPDATSRRASRQLLWSRRSEFSRPKREMPHPRTIETTVEAAPVPFLLCARVLGSIPPGKATLNGRPCEVRTWSDECSTYVAVRALAGPARLVLEDRK